MKVVVVAAAVICREPVAVFVCGLWSFDGPTLLEEPWGWWGCWRSGWRRAIVLSWDGTCMGWCESDDIAQSIIWLRWEEDWWWWYSLLELWMMQSGGGVLDRRLGELLLELLRASRPMVPHGLLRIVMRSKEILLIPLDRWWRPSGYHLLPYWRGWPLLQCSNY